MKKRIISALLTVVMTVMMLTAMCPAALAAPIELNVGVEYPETAVHTITSETDIGVTNPSETKNGITVSAKVSDDKKTLNIVYSGKPQGEGATEFTVKYSAGGVESTYTVTFNVVKPVTEVLPPEITSAEPTNLQLTVKQTDSAVKFTVNATGNGTISYRWRVDGVEVAVGDTFTIVLEDMTVDVHTVECVVSNTIDNTSKHDSVKWTVTVEEGDAPKITSEATSGKIDGTGSASFSVTAEGVDLKYQWYMVTGSKKEKVVDGTYGAIEYTGATTSKLTVKCTMAPKDASTKFICEVTGGNGLMTATGEYVLKITEDPDAEKVQKIEIVKQPNKTSYVVGETLDEEGLKIKVTTGKDEEEITTGFVCSPVYLEEAGKQTITVSYGGKTVTFTVMVEEAPHEHEWSDWKVDNSTPVKVYRECIAGDDCVAKEILSKETFIIQYPTIAAELGLTMGNDSADTDNVPSDTQEPEEEPEEPDTQEPEEDKKDDNKDDKKKSGNGILWAIIIIALVLLAAVIVFYLKVYRKPYKKPTNNNRR